MIIIHLFVEYIFFEYRRSMRKNRKKKYKLFSLIHLSGSKIKEISESKHAKKIT